MYKPLYKGIYKVGTVVIAPIRLHRFGEHVGSQLITVPLNRRFQPYIFCYDFPKTAKVVGKHTKKERKVETDIAIPLLYMILLISTFVSTLLTWSHNTSY